MEIKLNIHNNARQTAAAFAEKFIELCKYFINKNGIVSVLLSGGSTPKLFFMDIANNSSITLDWSNIHFFWGDERCVPPDHNDSNYLMTMQNLFTKIDIPIENIHRIKGENSPVSEAERYSQEINNVVRRNDGLPQFDITILGLGEDGHTASIFPNQMELLNSGNICEVAVHPVLGQKRITVTGKVLNNSEYVFFLATGESKSDKLKSILNKDENYLLYPASFIKPKTENLYFYIDKAAAKEII